MNDAGRPSEPHVHYFPEQYIGRRLFAFDTLDSTNSHALALAGDAANDGVAVLAAAQTQGRGQHGRRWQAPAGSSVLLSTLIFPPESLRRSAVLTAWAAVAVCEVASELVGIDARIKWPNDILVDGKKLCGILIEQRTVNLVPGEAGSLGRPATALATVVGIGLNVRQTAADFAGADLPQATSLALCSGTSQSAWDVALALVRRLDVEYGNLAAGVTDPLRQRWIERLGLVGRPIVAELHDGRYEGTLRELAFDRVHIERPGRGVVSLQPEAVRHLELAKESTT